jgi:Domain of unknown function (DUF4365)
MRKQRTRHHVIEDLGFNHIERQILYAGFTIQRNTHNDYGYDGLVYTFNEQGEINPFNFHIQLKSTDNIQELKKKTTISFDLSKRDLELWLLSTTKLLVVLYDAQAEIAYFIDLQEYFKENGLSLNTIRKYFRVNIPLANLFNTHNIKQLVHQ